MTGLQIEINKRKLVSRSPRNEKFSVGYIARLIDKTIQTTTHKLKHSTFSVDEMLGIFYTLIPKEKQSMEMFEYLFTEQI